MGFLKKLGNVVEDVGSFALPAGLTAGMTLLSGGTLNPATAGGLMSLLGTLGAGSKGLQANEQEERARKFQLAQQRAMAEMQQRNSQATARAGLVNALKPGAGARPELETQIDVSAPKAGMLERVAGGIGTGVQAAQMVDAANTARKTLQSKLATEAAQRAAAEAQTDLTKMGIGRAQEQAAVDLGGAKAAEVARLQAPERARELSAVRNGPSASNLPIPEMLQGGLNEAIGQAQPVGAFQRQGFDAANLAAQEVKQAGADRLTAASQAARDASRAEEASKQQASKALADQVTTDATAATEAQAKARELSDKQISDANSMFLQNNPRLKNLGMISNGYRKINAFVEQIKSGEVEHISPAAQYTVINLFQKVFVDEGLAVRKEDIDNLKAAMSLYEEAAVKLRSAAKGEIVDRGMILQLGDAADEIMRIYAEGVPAQLQGMIDTTSLTPDQGSRLKDMMLAPFSGLKIPEKRIGAGDAPPPGGSATLQDSLMESTGLDRESLLDSLIQERERRRGGTRSAMGAIGRVYQQ